MTIPPFTSIYVLDTEYCKLGADPPRVHCAVGKDLLSGNVRTWTSLGGGPPPYDSSPSSLVVCYAAGAEFSCMLELGWPLPPHVLDLHVQFLNLQNRHSKPCHASLLTALEHFKLPHINPDDKEGFRALAMQKEPLSGEQMTSLLHYCETDVDATCKLFYALLPHIDWPRALLAGRYTGPTVTTIERTGIPINLALYHRITTQWPKIRCSLRDQINERYGVYGPGGQFSHARFLALLKSRGIPWTYTPTGRPKTDEETFKEAGLRFPDIAPLLQTQILLTKLKTINLPIGSDGRNRTHLRPFASRTGRNQPRNSEFIFGLSSWARHLVCAPPGKVLVSLDYEQQEFLIGGAVSGDEAMLDAYATGDPYFALAIKSGAVPPNARREDHEVVRKLYKTAVLGLMYGAGERGLEAKVGSVATARKLIQDHRNTFSRYWAWVASVQQKVALRKNPLTSPLGWQIGCDSVEGLNHRSVANFTVQAAGADCMRVASIAMVERNLPLACTMHDGFLLVCPEDQADEMAEQAETILRDTSLVVLGHPCRVDVRRFAEGASFQDDKGKALFEEIISHLDNLEREAA